MLITSVCVCVCMQIHHRHCILQIEGFLKISMQKKKIHFNLKIGVKFDIIIQLSAILKQSKCMIHLFNKQITC